MVTSLKVMPMVEAVQIPFVRSFIADGRFDPNDVLESAMEGLQVELGRWVAALAPLRQVSLPELKGQKATAV